MTVIQHRMTAAFHVRLKQDILVITHLLYAYLFVETDLLGDLSNVMILTQILVTDALKHVYRKLDLFVQESPHFACLFVGTV